MTFSEPVGKEERRPTAGEQKYRSVLEAIEQVLSIGDFQKQVDHPVEPLELVELTARRVKEIIPFEVGAVYLVDQTTSDIRPACFFPEERKGGLQECLPQLIENGYIAWALRERRGLTVFADHRNRVLLHVMATYSRIRGIFIGLLPARSPRLPDGSLQVLSLLLRNAANTLESLEYLEMFKRQNAELQTRVDEKVSELRKRDSQMLNARKMDAIATLASGVAHQYNNALAMLFGYRDLTKMAVASGRDVAKYAERIETAAERMRELTSKLLAYARGGKYNPETLFIEDLVEIALNPLKKNVEQPIEVLLTLPPRTFRVHVDATQMQLAVSAIITNASEALESGGRIRIDATKVSLPESSGETPVQLSAGEYILLRIADDGRGMDEETLQHIFEPFFSTKFMGRGLSMAATYGIVKNHHGEITVESTVGKGTTVQVYLPAID